MFATPGRTRSDLKSWCSKSDKAEDVERIRQWAVELKGAGGLLLSKREACRLIAESRGWPVPPAEDVPLDPEDLDPVSGDPLLDPVRASNGFAYNVATLDELWRRADQEGKDAPPSPLTRQALLSTWDPQPETRNRVRAAMRDKGYDLGEAEYVALLRAPLTTQREPQAVTLPLRRILRRYADDWAVENELDEDQRADLQREIAALTQVADEIDKVQRLFRASGGKEAEVLVDKRELLPLLNDHVWRLVQQGLAPTPEFADLLNDAIQALYSQQPSVAVGGRDYLGLLSASLDRMLVDLATDDEHPWTREMAQQIQDAGGLSSALEQLLPGHSYILWMTRPSL